VQFPHHVLEPFAWPLGAQLAQRDSGSSDWLLAVSLSPQVSPPSASPFALRFSHHVSQPSARPFAPPVAHDVPEPSTEPFAPLVTHHVPGPFAWPFAVQLALDVSAFSEVQKGKLQAEGQTGLQADVSRVPSAHPVWLEQTLPRISESPKGRKAVLAWVQACLRCAQGGGCWWVNDKQRISVQERRVPGSSLEESN
jgi:hypothetical protein